MAAIRTSDRPPWSDMAAINPVFAERIGLARTMKLAKSDLKRWRIIEPQVERRAMLLNSGSDAGVGHAFGAAFDMEVRDPTADVRLIEFCLSIPPEQDTLGGGARMLMRRAMEGILPAEVQWNLIRGRQGADVALRLLHHAGEMDELLERFAFNGSVCQYLDLPLMRQLWTDLQAGGAPQSMQRATAMLLRSASCGCFIENAAAM